MEGVHAQEVAYGGATRGASKEGEPRGAVACRMRGGGDREAGGAGGGGGGSFGAGDDLYELVQERLRSKRRLEAAVAAQRAEMAVRMDTGVRLNPTLAAAWGVAVAVDDEEAEAGGGASKRRCGDARAEPAALASAAPRGRGEASSVGEASASASGGEVEEGVGGVGSDGAEEERGGGAAADGRGDGGARAVTSEGVVALHRLLGEETTARMMGGAAEAAGGGGAAGGPEEEAAEDEGPGGEERIEAAAAAESGGERGRMCGGCKQAMVLARADRVLTCDGGCNKCLPGHAWRYACVTCDVDICADCCSGATAVPAAAGAGACDEPAHRGELSARLMRTSAVGEEGSDDGAEETTPGTPSDDRGAHRHVCDGCGAAMALTCADKVLTCDGGCGKRLPGNVRRLACSACDVDVCEECCGGAAAAAAQAGDKARGGACSAGGSAISKRARSVSPVSSSADGEEWRSSDGLVTPMFALGEGQAAAAGGGGEGGRECEEEACGASEEREGEDGGASAAEGGGDGAGGVDGAEWAASSDEVYMVRRLFGDEAARLMGDGDGGAETEGKVLEAERRAEAVRAAARVEGGARLNVAHWNPRCMRVGPLFGEAADEEDREARGKREWLDTQLAAAPPTVLFIYEAQGTRVAWADKGGLRDWLGVRGYAAHLVCGAGMRNGVVVAVRTVEAKYARLPKKLAERTVGVEVRCSADKRVHRLVGMHGLHKESRACDFDAAGCPRMGCYEWQVEEAFVWLSGGTAGGEGVDGLLGGDFNRVVRADMRRGEHSMTGDDKRLAARCGLVDGQQVAARAELVVGMPGAPAAQPWTRWETSRGGAEGEPTACIDFAIAVGNEVGEWARSIVAKPDVATSGGSRRMVSDHAYVQYSRRVMCRAALDKRRPMPIRVGGRAASEAVKAAYAARTRHDPGWKAVVEEARRTEGEVGVVKALRAQGEAAEADVAAGKPARAEGAAAPETPRARFQRWTKRLAVALRMVSDGGCSVEAAESPAFAGSRGLRRLLVRGGGGPKAWQRVVQRCRDEVAAAGRAQNAAAKERDAELMEAAEGLRTAGKEDAIVRMQRAWRAIRGRRSNLALEAIWRGDRLPKDGWWRQQGRPPRITYASPEFLGELKRAGEAFVAQMADTPACLPAFEAWCDLFMEAFSELRGSDGGDFVLAKELTWDVFQEVLSSMPGGKSVGKLGFSIELLRQAGPDAQRAFYQALLTDLKEGHVPEHWRTVLYALLAKPAPSNPELIHQRREIALMPQDMKLLLQMVRRVAYQRIVGRVAAVQAGWLSGYGCADTGSIAAHVIQQSNRRQLPLYLLYIDLATFFPRLDRKAVTIAEALHGLPKEVRELSLLIYGSAEQPERAVQCHYDSAGGLGGGFRNWMGALMGCVLSPDKAKLFLNTVMVAIDAVCKGVRLWGYGRDEVEATWRSVAHGAYADDWIGCFRSVQDLRRAWAIWRTWEAAAGCKLGVKGKAKTVVTGVRYEKGMAVSVEDPLLRMRDGSIVPFMLHDEAYKHVGAMRRADGDDTAAWLRLRRLCMAAIARLRAMRRPSRNEFIMVSNALLGGLAGFYLQSLYITFEQAEEIEAAWRKVFRAKFGGRGVEAWSKPRAYFYAEQGAKRQRREHVWATGLAALVAHVNAAVADVHDTPQRAAARSSVALAMERWGCRADPNRWSWAHLRGALEASLRSRRCKQLGDAWMLATALLEEGHAELWEAEGQYKSKWHRDFGREQRAEHGRWEGAAPPGDPLHSGAAHWVAPDSALVSEPGDAGLGLEPEPFLLEAGVVSVGDMSKQVIVRAEDGTHGSIGFEWMSMAEARRANRRLPSHGACAAAWKRQVDRLKACGAQPGLPERATQEGRAREIGAQPGLRECAVDYEAVQRTCAALEEAGTCTVRSKEEWSSELRKCFPSAERRPAREWDHGGGRDRAREAKGARIVMVVQQERTVQVAGGQARWCRRAEADYVPGGADERGLPAVGEDGWLEGHEERKAQLLRRMAIDREGFSVDEDGRRYDAEGLHTLPPALQIQARARLALHAVAPDAPVVDVWPVVKKKKKRKEEGVLPGRRPGGEEEAEGGRQAEEGAARAPAGRKESPGGPGRGEDRGAAAGGEQEEFKETTINLAAMRRNREELAMWQARIGATAVYTVDASRDRVPIPGAKDGAAEYVVARAAMRHDGARFGGILYEAEGADNYIGELAAQLDAGAAEGEGGRIVIVFDATSPVLAMRKLRRQCYRRRQGRYVGRWLEALFRFLDRQEVVVMLWQTSHVGSVVNEWADVEAADFAHALGDAVPVPRLACEHASMQYTMPRTSSHAWAAELAPRVVQTRLEGVCTASAFAGWECMPALELDDRTQQACDAVASQRSCPADPKRFQTQMMARFGIDSSCPHGCRDEAGAPAAFTWEHAQLFCAHPTLVALRDAWVDKCEACAKALGELAEVPHDQLLMAARTARSCAAAAPRTRGGPTTQARKLRAGELKTLRQVVAGHIRCTGQPQTDRNKGVRHKLVDMVKAGAAVQHAAWEEARPLEEEMKAVSKVRRVARLARHWIRYTREGGPKRIAGLRAAHDARHLVEGALAVTACDAADDDEEAEQALRDIDGAGEELSRLVACDVARVTKECPRRGAGAYQDWRHLALLQRWRVVAAARGMRRSRAHGGPARRQSRAEWVATREAEGLGRGEVAAGVAGAGCGRVAVIDPGTLRLAEVGVHEGGFGMRYDTSGWRPEDFAVGVPQLREPRRGLAGEVKRWDGNPRVLGLVEREQEASRRWKESGGRAGEMERRRLAAASAVRVEVLRRGVRMKRYFSQVGGEQAVGLSGGALTAGSGIMQSADPAPGGGAGRRRRARRGGAGAAPGGPVEASPDRFGRWPVERVLEVRLATGATRATASVRHVEARVRWAGVDRDTGLPWTDAWLASTDAAGATVFNAALKREVGVLMEAKYGRRFVRRGGSGGGGGAGGGRQAEEEDHDLERAAWRKRWRGVASRRGRKVRTIQVSSGESSGDEEEAVQEERWLVRLSWSEPSEEEKAEGLWMRWVKRTRRN